MIKVGGVTADVNWRGSVRVCGSNALAGRDHDDLLFFVRVVCVVLFVG